MSGGTQLTSRVSAALRNAGLPVLRYQDKISTGSRSGIKVGNGPWRGSSWVSITVWVDEVSHDRDQDAEQEWSDKALAVLIARGFNASRRAGHPAILVEASAPPAQAEEDVQAVVAASGLDISQPTRNEWLIAVDGARGAYSIRRTGKGDKARYAVHARGYGNELARNLRTMAAAIETLKKNLAEREQ